MTTPSRRRSGTNSPAGPRGGTRRRRWRPGSESPAGAPTTWPPPSVGRRGREEARGLGASPEKSDLFDRGLAVLADELVPEVDEAVDRVAEDAPRLDLGQDDPLLL